LLTHEWSVGTHDHGTDRVTSQGNRLSDKYKGILSKKQGESLNEHIKQMREEWDREYPLYLSEFGFVRLMD
jgi:hypothetical protein